MIKALKNIFAVMLLLVGMSGLSVPAFSQTYTTPTLEGDNTYTGTNTFNNTVTNNGTVTNTANTNLYLINGIPQADQFTGSDFCVKLRAAETYALGHNISTVDATHFSNQQSCSVDPFTGLVANGVNVNLKVELPAAVISYTVPININYDGLYLQGAGRLNTVWAYTGACSSNQIAFSLSATTGYVQFNTLKDFSVVTTTASGCNGYDFYLSEAHRNHLENISIWGNAYGYVTAGAVDDTMIDVRVSNQEAATAGWSGYQTPTHGYYFGSGHLGDGTTNSTVIGLAAEGIAGIGIECYYCNTMNFSSGTSESNSQGITMDSHSTWNVWTAMDIEGNTNTGSSGNDYYDVGGGNTLVGGLYASACTACNSVYQGGAIGNDIMLSAYALHTGAGGYFNVIGDATSLGNRPGLGIGTWTLTSAILQAPIFTSDSSAPTLIGGTGITSVTCADPSGSGVSCTSARGTIHVVNSSATTTSSFVQMNWASTLASKPSCQLSQVGGATSYLGLYVSGVSTTSLFIANLNTLSGITDLYIAYSCEL